MFGTRSRFVSAGAALLGGLTSGSAASSAQFEVKCATNLTVDHPVNVRITQMWKKIEAESGGRIRAQLFPNSALGSDASMFAQLRQGALEFLLVNSGSLAAVVPAADVANVGFAFKDDEEAIRAFQGPLGGYVQTQTAGKGLHLTRSPWDGGSQQIAIGPSGHPVRAPEDLRSLKLRVPPSPILVGLFKEFGSNVIALGLSEVYTSLQTKLIDGETSSLATIESFKFYEALKFITLSPAYPYRSCSSSQTATCGTDCRRTFKRSSSATARRTLSIGVTRHGASG